MAPGKLGLIGMGVLTIAVLSLLSIRTAFRKSAPAPRNDVQVALAGYREYMDTVCALNTCVLDLPPERWAAPTVKHTFAAPEKWTFTADDIPPPADAEVDRWRADADTVRPVPYPFFRMHSIASDCCATHTADLLYTHTLIARRYGIDATSSFFPFSSYRASPSVFCAFEGRSKEPRVRPVRIEEQAVDAFALLASYYHRGWVDHLHSWSVAAASGYSIVAPTELAVPASGTAEEQLPVAAVAPTTWEGLAVTFAGGAGVETFELTLTGHDGIAHTLVYGLGLAGRPGWELPAIPKGGTVYLHRAEEKNARLDATLGMADAKGFPCKAITAKAGGKSGARLGIESIELFDLTRAMVLQQMQKLRQLNILPSASTFHGGNNHWANCIPRVQSLVHQVDTTAGAKREARSDNGAAMGATPGTPAYHADLLRQYGCDRFIAYNVPSMAVALPDGSTIHRFKSSTAARPGDGSGIPMAGDSLYHFENLGPMIAAALATPAAFGEPHILHTHFNFFNAGAFTNADSGAQMHTVKKLHPYTEAGLQVLANCKYDLDGKRRYWDRVWVCPPTVQARYLQTLGALRKHVSRDGDVIRIQPWTDAVTGATVPDAQWITQDLHGQTFYVPDAQRARVFVGACEIKSLTRNPKDFTGRESVTIVDTGYPTSILDDVDFYEMNGRVVQQNASSFFTTGAAYKGRHALEVRLDGDGAGSIAWEPVVLDSYETDYLRFAYRKTNPHSRVFIEIETADKKKFTVTEAALDGCPGWVIPAWTGPEYREVVVDFAQMQAPAGTTKFIPRQRIRAVRFGIERGQAGDGASFDRVEFLSARGNRPYQGAGLVLGGRLHPPRDGETVYLRLGAQVRETVTTRGGWFYFTDVPADAVAEIFFERHGVRYWPLRGRLTQAVKNDVDYHIFATDPRSPSVPRPLTLIGKTVDKKHAPRSVNSEETRARFESYLAPHSMRYYAGTPGTKWSYLVEDTANNFGYIDRDRRFDNPDKALRILIQGECWTEGGQTYMGQHMNLLLESILRRETGVPVEVLVTATSSSSPASWSLNFEKYGQKFQPDLTLVFLNPFNLGHLEPALLEKLIGWQKDHSPYQMYDFGPDGKLVGYPPDPTFTAFQVAPNPAPLVGTVPLRMTYFVADADHALVRRSFALLKAVVSERYLAPMRAFGGEFGIIYGYDYLPPEYGLQQGGNTLAAEKWFFAIKEACDDMGVHAVDLSPQLRRESFGALMLWEHDTHLTPAGHYKIANAVAREILRMPSMQERIRARKQ